MKDAMFDGPSLKTIDHVSELIRSLSQSPQFTLILATSNQTPRAHHVLKKLGLSQHFNDRVFGSDMTGGVKKPYPLIHRLAIGDDDPEKCLIIEDSPVGIQAAKQAGAFVVHFSDPRFNQLNSKTHFEKASADMTVTDYRKFEDEVSKKWQHWPLRQPEKLGSGLIKSTI